MQMYACNACIPHTCLAPEALSTGRRDPLELDLQRVVNHHRVLAIQPESPARASSTLNCSVTSLDQYSVKRRRLEGPP